MFAWYFENTMSEDCIFSLLSENVIFDYIHLSDILATPLLK